VDEWAPNEDPRNVSTAREASLDETWMPRSAFGTFAATSTSARQRRDVLVQVVRRALERRWAFDRAALLEARVRRRRVADERVSRHVVLL
jgi:hypothetical protein